MNRSGESHASGRQSHELDPRTTAERRINIRFTSATSGVTYHRQRNNTSETGSPREVRSFAGLATDAYRKPPDNYDEHSPNRERVILLPAVPGTGSRRGWEHE